MFISIFELLQPIPHSSVQGEQVDQEVLKVFDIN